MQASRKNRSDAFSDPARCQLLRASAEAWVRTPFHPHSAIRGVGVDCVRLAAALYREVGVIGEVEFPRYDITEGMHLAESQVIQWLRGRDEFRELPSADPDGFICGDLLAFKISRCSVVHHVGVHLGGDPAMFVNSVHRYGVVIRRLDDTTWRNALVGAFRPLI